MTARGSMATNYLIGFNPVVTVANEASAVVQVEMTSAPSQVVHAEVMQK